MNDLPHNTFTPTLPFKSVAGALLFSAILGPVGLLYSSFAGGVMMIVLGVLTIRAQLLGLAIVVWLVCCIWSVAAVNRYNANILRLKNQ